MLLVCPKLLNVPEQGCPIRFFEMAEIEAKAIANVVTEHLNYSGYCKQNRILNLIQF